MKKLIGILLALMVAVTGAAFAEMKLEPVTLEEPILAASEQSVLVEFVEPDSTLTYVLLGAGNGLDAFKAFDVDMNDYEEDYGRVWDFLSAMQPTVTVNGKTALQFDAAVDADSKSVYTEVSANGTVIARLKGMETFAIVSREAEDVVPTIMEGCGVVVWRSTGTEAHPVKGETSNLCVHCGQFDNGNAAHDTEISRYCEEGHTECMGDPIHHCESCDQDYPCSKSGSHTKCAKCGQPWCYKEKGDHKELDCGHRGCEVYGHEEEHAKCDGCDGYLCDGKDHNHAEPTPTPDPEPTTAPTTVPTTEPAPGEGDVTEPTA